MSAALMMRITVPRPIWPHCPLELRNEWIASQVSSIANRPAKYRKYRWMFWMISGNRVSPVYLACGSATAQAGGDSQKAR